MGPESPGLSSLGPIGPFDPWPKRAPDPPPEKFTYDAPVEKSIYFEWMADEAWLERRRMRELYYVIDRSVSQERCDRCVMNPFKRGSRVFSQDDSMAVAHFRFLGAGADTVALTIDVTNATISTVATIVGFSSGGVPGAAKGYLSAEVATLPFDIASNSFSTAGMILSVMGDVAAGDTDLFEERISNASINSVVLTTAGWVPVPSHIDVLLSATALANDFNVTSIPCGCAEEE